MGKSTESLYGIDIYKLPEGEHRFSFRLDDSFFEHMGRSIARTGALQVDVVLDKSTTLIKALFHIQGQVELVCDRSLDPFDHPVDLVETLYYKFADEAKDDGDDIVYISWNQMQIRVDQPVFDFVITSLPMRKLHPRFAHEAEDTQDALVYTTGGEEESNTPETPSKPDPRWAALNQLKDKK